MKRRSDSGIANSEANLMDFFGIGFGEILLIIVIALIIFGPKRMPEIARTIGRMSRSLRKTTSDFTASLTKEIDTAEKDQSSQSKAASQDKADEPSPQPPDTATDKSAEIEKQP
jgi:sec-independent protein translocase protein TatA